MDVDVEVAQINARVQALIDRRAREAIARMDARWPASDAVIVVPPRNSVEAWGQILRSLHDAFVSIAESFARGWTAIDRASQ